MVNAGVPPACSSWPGVISRSTTMPAIGARMTDVRAGHCRLGESASTDAESTPRARKLLTGRVAVGRGRGEIALRLIEVGPGQRVVGEELLVQRVDAPRIAPAPLRPCDSPPPPTAKSGEITVASGCPTTTESPRFTSRRCTGPDSDEITCVDLSPLKVTVPVVRTVG